METAIVSFTTNISCILQVLTILRPSVYAHRLAVPVTTHSRRHTLTGTHNLPLVSRTRVKGMCSLSLPLAAYGWVIDGPSQEQ